MITLEWLVENVIGEMALTLQILKKYLFVCTGSQLWPSASSVVARELKVAGSSALTRIETGPPASEVQS